MRQPERSSGGASERGKKATVSGRCPVAALPQNRHQIRWAIFELIKQVFYIQRFKSSPVTQFGLAARLLSSGWHPRS